MGVSQTDSLHILVVSGVSGAGKTTVARALEDVGYYCVDNLPPALLPSLLELFGGPASPQRLAVVLDVRAVALSPDLGAAIKAVLPGEVSVLFLDASDEALVRRFSETRRRPPLAQPGEPPTLALERERTLLGALRAQATLTVDTSLMTVHELRKRVVELFGSPLLFSPVLALWSFGFKHGLPAEADYVFDVRHLPNPHFVDALREQTGQAPAVQQFLESQPEVEQLLQHITALLEYSVPRHDAEGRLQLTVAVGCTGGKHRSVYCVEQLAARLASPSRQIQVRHRDVAR